MTIVVIYDSINIMTLLYSIVITYDYCCLYEILTHRDASPKGFGHGPTALAGAVERNRPGTATMPWTGVALRSLGS